MNCVSLFLLVICLWSKYTYGVIYHLNASEYSRMPPIYSMDNYDLCMEDPNGLYCIYHVDLYSDTSSPLMDMIKEYSEDTAKHFNHSRLYYATCVTRSCKNFLKDSMQAPREILEECLSALLTKKYLLKSRVMDDIECFNSNNLITEITMMDFLVAICVFILFGINLVATLYDFCSFQEEFEGTKVMRYFSLRRNWKRLMAPVNNSDPRLDKMKSFYGVRCITTIIVVMAHNGISIMLFTKDTHYFENMYNNLAYHIVFNGLAAMQTHFFISGLLLVYNIELYGENHKLSWKVVARNIFLRWLKFSVPYVFALAITSTWQRFAGAGALREIYFMKEIKDCQETWWRHILYINNYYDESFCYQHTWFLGVDMHLFILGCVVCVACKTTRLKVIVLSSLAFLGFAIPAFYIYFQDLDGVVIISPTVCEKFFTNSQAFNILHRRTHTNLIGFVIGMTFGYLIYYLEKINFNLKQYKKFSFLYWTLVPIAFGGVFSGSIFYNDGPKHSLTFRTIYGAFNKPVFTILIALILAGFIFKVENIYRSIVEWPGWVVPSRLGFSVFLLHVPVLKILHSLNSSLSSISFYIIIKTSIISILLSYSVALFFSLLVESPLTQLLSQMKSKKIEEFKKSYENDDDAETNKKTNNFDNYRNKIE